MARRVACAFAAFAALGILTGILGVEVGAQVSTAPYRLNNHWLDKVKGRTIGVVSGVRMDPDGKHIWLLDRCGANGCGEFPDVDPIIQLDLEGNLIKSFGKGKMGFVHGFWVDKEGNVWVTDGAPVGDPRLDAGLKHGIGHQVFKWSPDGKLLMTLGTAAVAGADQTHLNGPSGVAIDAEGNIWVTDGHGGPQTGTNKNNMFGSRGGNCRLVKFDKNGKFIRQWGGGPGTESYEPLRFNDPHDITIDDTGRILIADRGNARIQVLDKDGNFITQWTQFGKPSAVVVDHEHVYVADGMSDSHWNPGWERGIRVGDLKTGWIVAFIPDLELIRGTGTEFLGIDLKGNIFAGSASRPGVQVQEPYRPF